MSKRRVKCNHNRHWWLKYNVCNCIQGHLGWAFEFKSSITSKHLSYSTSGLGEWVNYG